MIRLTPDSSWGPKVDLGFGRLSGGLYRAAASTTNEVVDDVEGVVQRGLRRPENANRRSSGGLTRAIVRSIKVENQGLSPLLGIGHEPTLDELAVYWRAIELGSTHLVGSDIRVVKFGTRTGGAMQGGGQSVPTGARSGDDPDAIAGREGNIGGNLAKIARPIENPIEAHNYLDELGDQAFAGFSRRVLAILTTEFTS